MPSCITHNRLLEHGLQGSLSTTYFGEVHVNMTMLPNAKVWATPPNNGRGNRKCVIYVTHMCGAVNSYMNQISNLITYISVVIHHHCIIEIAPSMQITCDKHTCFTAVALSCMIQLCACTLYIFGCVQEC